MGKRAPITCIQILKQYVTSINRTGEFLMVLPSHNDPVILPFPSWSISQGSSTSGITVSGEDVYVSGEHNYDGIDRVCYWKNGELNDVPSPQGSIDQYSSAMVVIDDTVYKGGGYNYMYDFNSYWRPCYWTDIVLTNLDDSGQEAYINSSMWWWD
jgi:hypothetical protein